MSQLSQCGDALQNGDEDLNVQIGKDSYVGEARTRARVGANIGAGGQKILSAGHNLFR